jgi:sugar (pentulose or hexulose) kinase
MQLYWLKHTKPEVFQKVRWSLFLPQYLSWLFTGIAVNDYTSIGCHTMLWDFSKGDYHDWVHEEGIDRVLPPVVASDSAVNVDSFTINGPGKSASAHPGPKESQPLGSPPPDGRAGFWGAGGSRGKSLRVGIGIHDSSAALIPYLRMNKEPFVLISTGTWSVTLNPFSTDPLSDEDLRNDCLNYMRIQGKPVRASRLFLGNEHDLQVARLNHHYSKSPGYHKQVRLDDGIAERLKHDFRHHFKFESIGKDRVQTQATSLDGFRSFEEAYHQLMMELVELQVRSTEHALGNTRVSTVCVDGGFARNDIFMKFLAINFKDLRVVPTNFTSGAALGAAMVISGQIQWLDEVSKS